MRDTGTFAGKRKAIEMLTHKIIAIARCKRIRGGGVGVGVKLA